MDRIVVKRSATLSRTFTFTPTGTPTVALARVSDGTSVTASSMSGSGTSWSYTIPASSNTLLDTYVETITAQSGGEAQTFTDYIDVAGGVLFDLSELTAVKPSTLTWTTAQMSEMRNTVEDAIEEEYGTALVPRYVRETFNGDGASMLRLRDPVRAIRSASVSGTALSAGDLALLTSQYGFIDGYRWAAGIGNVTIGYEYGLDRPPARIKLDALTLAKNWLIKGPIDDRTTTMSSTDSGITAVLAIPGRGGSIFGLPDLDAAIQASPYRVKVA